MQVMKSRLLIVAVVMIGGGFTAQAAQAPAPAPRVVVASAKLPSVVDAPRYFRVLNVTLPAGQTSTVSGPSSILYQISGSTIVSMGSETKTINAGEGVFIANGMAAELKAGDGGPSVLFH